MPIIEALAWGVAVGVLTVFFVGLRRLPWRHAIVVGVGMGVVFAALRLSTLDATFDRSLLVLLGAVGGSIATHGSVAGEHARVRRSAEILAGRPSSTA